MRKLNQVWLVLLFFLVSSVVSAQDLHTQQLSKNLYQLNFTSSYLGGRSESMLLIVPDNYAQNPKLHYPSVYLLHGYSGNYRDWVKNYESQLVRTANNDQMILVMPDGLYGSWFLNSPISESSQYATMFVTELIPTVDKNFRTIASREKRAITGLSMGGYGSFYLAGTHPELFGAVGGISGVYTLKDSHSNSVWVVLGTDQSKWTNYNIDNFLPQFRKYNTAIIFDVGTEDYLLPTARRLHTEMLQEHILHNYGEAPGVHDWNYWLNSIDYQLLFFQRYFTGQNQPSK
jgi:S-formylglutathione hydrolase FrmB